jgi:hypothetical protein
MSRGSRRAHRALALAAPRAGKVPASPRKTKDGMQNPVLTFTNAAATSPQPKI